MNNMNAARRVLAKALQAPRSLTFAELCALVESFGFEHSRTKGSHVIYKRAGVAELVNVQNVGGKAKAYQVRQLLDIVERNNLTQEPKL
jgi:predicted RNA binding protein YcfA (HicA-like mRNA interferase family)